MVVWPFTPWKSYFILPESGEEFASPDSTRMYSDNWICSIITLGWKRLLLVVTLYFIRIRYLANTCTISVPDVNLVKYLYLLWDETQKYENLKLWCDASCFDSHGCFVLWIKVLCPWGPFQRTETDQPCTGLISSFTFFVTSGELPFHPIPINYTYLMFVHVYQC